MDSSTASILIDRRSYCLLVDRNGKAQQGFLKVADIFNLNLPADLVVLSACQTALGSDIKGEGLVGMTRAFMYAGGEACRSQPRKVDDLATAELMTAFYRRLAAGKNPAAALQKPSSRSSGSRLGRHPTTGRDSNCRVSSREA